MTRIEKLAAYATILGLPIAILGLVLAFFQLRTPEQNSVPGPAPQPINGPTPTGDNPNYLSGWTTTFEDHQVLQGQGGIMSLYDREVVPGFHVFVHIPKERVLKSEWMRDGDGQSYLAVTLTAP
jgi:hypothetical protein